MADTSDTIGKEWPQYPLVGDPTGVITLGWNFDVMIEEGLALRWCLSLSTLKWHQIKLL